MRQLIIHSLLLSVLLSAACSTDNVAHDQPEIVDSVGEFQLLAIPSRWSVKAFVEAPSYFGNGHTVAGALWQDNDTYRYRFSRTDTGLDTAYFDYDHAAHGYAPEFYSTYVMPNGDVLFVFRTEFSGGSTTDSNRRNPVLYVAAEGYKAHVIDFGSSLKPSGWLQNVGAYYSYRHKALFIAEYTRGNLPTARCWRVDEPISDPANWHVVLEHDIVKPYGTGFKHFHTAQGDAYADVLYLTSGDDDTSSGIWASTDGGQSFNQLGAYNRRQWRMLNMVFTPEYIFWASDDWSDSWPNHALWRARRDFRGVLDPNSLVEVYNFRDLDRQSLIYGDRYLRLATYSTVYLRKYNALLLLDRDDDAVHNAIQLRVYDINEDKMHIAGEIRPTRAHALWGFRCETVEIYPEDDEVLVSFAPRYEKLFSPPAGSDPDLNEFAVTLKVTRTDTTYRVTMHRPIVSRKIRR